MDPEDRKLLELIRESGNVRVAQEHQERIRRLEQNGLLKRDSDNKHTRLTEAGRAAISN